MKIATLALAFMAISAVAHAEQPQADKYKPIWTEEKTRNRLATANYLLIAADIVTTKVALSNGGKEANPILRPIMGKIGVNGGLALDAIFRAFVIHRLSAREGSNPYLVIDGAISGLVVANNINEIRK